MSRFLSLDGFLTMGSTRLFAISALVFALASTGGRATAQDSNRLELGDTYRRFSVFEYAAAGSALVASGVIRLVFDTPPKPRIRGGILFDAPVRNAVRLEDRPDREVAADVSDWLWYGTQGVPVLVDALLVPLATDDLNTDVAWQMTAMNYEAFAVAGILTALSHAFIGRERPSGYDCDSDPNYDGLCLARGRYASFLSGHTSMAFTSAGLSCAHHQYLPLYGGGTWDAIACGAILVAATTTGLLRMVSDRHYFSDVFLSAALGFAIGYFMPVLLHYRGREAPAEPATTMPVRLGEGDAPPPTATLRLAL